MLQETKEIKFENKTNLPDHDVILQDIYNATQTVRIYRSVEGIHTGIRIHTTLTALQSF